MTKYLIDANVPYYFSLWQNELYQHIIDIDPHMRDSEIWAYAKQHNLTIITKDADFSNLVLLNTPPPRVIHNMDFYTYLKSLQNLQKYGFA